LDGHLNQRGITNGVMPNFQGYGPDWMVNSSNWLKAGSEDEWAEAVTSLLVYARNTRHLRFNLVAPNNEPDLGSEGIYISAAAQYLTALRALARKLDTNGLSDVRIVGPDRSNSGTNWLPEMLSDPVVMSKVGHFGAHSYGGWGSGSAGVYDLLRRSAYPDRTFWMTEFNVWCTSCEAGVGNTNDWAYCRGTAEYLLAHLANGASGGLVWEGYDSYYPHHGRWSFWGLLGVDDPNAFPRTYTRRKNFYTLAQITRFVRPGARQIDISGSADPFYFVAFFHPATGQFTLTGENTGSSPATLAGTLTNLPLITTLDLYYTDAGTNLCHSTAVPVTNGSFAVAVPGDCIFTLTGFDLAKIAVSVLITHPPNGQHYSAPATIPLQAIATSSTGTLSTVEFYNGANQIGQAAPPPYACTWSNIVPGAYVLTAGATNSLGYVGVSPGVRVIVTGPATQISVAPTNALLVPYAVQQFTATARDALGNDLDPPPPITWSVNAGGTITGGGLLAAWGDAGGPYTVSARCGSVTGTTSFSITTNLNLAPAGAGGTWYAMSTPTNNQPAGDEPGINDGDLQTDVPLTLTGAEDSANAYEAAGVIWSTPQRISRVVYYNGSYDPYHDGVFAAQFGLQFSPDGQTWTNAGPDWVLTPPYTYNSSISANTNFTFSGGAVTVLGVRCVGQVHTAQTPANSWVAYATELQAFAAPAVPAPVLKARTVEGALVVCWPDALTNYLLESNTNLFLPLNWSAVTNVPVASDGQLSVTLPLWERRCFFRLHQQP
jgi:O-glycosyl hydrolase